MISVRELELILTEQRQELTDRTRRRFCDRPEEALLELDSVQAQVVVGVRRAGKSTLCHRALAKAGVNFAYVNFDDERLARVNSDNLNPILETLYKIYGSFTHLFLDEIQNVEGWHLFVNRLLRRDLRVVIAGSNAKLLSGELATHLTGRHHVVQLFPLSFAEYCDCMEVDTRTLTTEMIAARRRAFDDYMKQGGFPELLRIAHKRDYISDLTESILKRDIEARFNIRRQAIFERLANHLLNIAPTTISYTKLSADMGLKSPHTLQTYTSYLRQAFMLLPLHKYSAKSRQRLTGEKAYCVDPAFMDKRPDAFSGENLGRRLETIVFLELKRRCLRRELDLYYLSDGKSECNFILCRGNQTVEAIQVSYDIQAEKTRRREIRGLEFAARKTGCKSLTLITDHEYADVCSGTLSIKIRPAYEWLLNDNSTPSI